MNYFVFTLTGEPGAVIIDFKYVKALYIGLI